MSAGRVGVVCLGLFLATSSAWSQDYPNKPIRVIVATAPGGVVDITARLFGQSLTERLGQPIVVENKPGANGAIGSEFVARSAPDGYTIQMGMSAAHVMNPLLRKDLSYSMKDFAPITLVARFPLVIVVPSASPAKTLQEFVELSRKNKAALSYSSAGTGSTPHLAGARFQQVTQLDMEHIPYAGEAPSLLDVVGGRISISFPALAGAMPHVKAGTIRPLAIMARSRSPLLPDVPTTAEAGFPNLEFGTWYGLLAPTNAPKDAVARLDGETRKVALEDKVIQKIRELGGDPTPMASDAFGEFIQSEIKKYGEIVSSTGVKLE